MAANSPEALPSDEAHEPDRAGESGGQHGVRRRRSFPESGSKARLLSEGRSKSFPERGENMMLRRLRSWKAAPWEAAAKILKGVHGVIMATMALPDETRLSIVDEEDEEDEEEKNDSPIEEVRLTVPITDHPSELVLTFRTWVLGLFSCCLLAFVNQFFKYRQNPLDVSVMSAQIIVLPLGRLMAATLPSKTIRLPLTNFSFSLNPGPFTLKEHVLITLLASVGVNSVFAVDIITIVKAFYHKNLHPLAAFLLAQTTQMFGYGLAGLFRKFLVDSPFMWWPDTLVEVSLFRALHEKEQRPRGGRTKLQFFILVCISSFAYYVIPGYLFPSISCISIACLIWKKSITAQQIGSGWQGLGIGSFGLDWSGVVSFLGNPLATPAFAIINILAGFFLTVYVMLPIAYWSNLYQAKSFPIISSQPYDSKGNPYNITQVLNDQTFDFKQVGYDNYSKVHLSILFVLSYGLSFATLTATISHVALFNGKEIRNIWRKTTTMMDQQGDVHTRIMRRNYKPVPHWWFYTILVMVVVLALGACEGFGKQLQLPWWGFLLSCGIALFFTLPIGIIQATTNMPLRLDVITELIIGYIYPGKPLANMTFKTYGSISISQALKFLSDFKLGHYMKIPPRAMFTVQLVGVTVASTVYFSTGWWLLTSIPNICDESLLPEGSQWTCPEDKYLYHTSIILGIVGPRRMFTRDGVYPEMNWFFLVGLLAPVPVWLLTLKFPDKKWMELINMPLIIGATAGMMPPASSIHFITWGAVGIFFNLYVQKKYKEWWTRRNYILAAGLDIGVAFMAVLLYVTLQSKDINGPKWWGSTHSDCPLADFSTDGGTYIDGY